MTTDGEENSTDGLPRHLQRTLQRLLAGDSQRQIAEHLGLSRHTVHDYVKAIYRRFKVKSRAQLMALHVKRDEDDPRNQTERNA